MCVCVCVCVLCDLHVCVAVSAAMRVCVLWCVYMPFMMAYLCTRLLKLCTNWSQYITSALEPEEFFSYVFCQMQLVETAESLAKSLKTWPPILQRHILEPQSLFVVLESNHVFTRVLLTSSSAKLFCLESLGNFRSRGQPSIRWRP